jgi:hypothetical protein
MLDSPVLALMWAIAQRFGRFPGLLAALPT